MANAVESLDATCPIKSPADKFYNFFKFDTNEIVKIFPLGFTSITLVEGLEGQVGCVKQWNYILGGIPLSAKTRLDALDDDAKSLTFNVIDGDLLLVYNSFKATITVSEGSVKWTLSYEKSTLLSPPPQLYIPLVIAVSTLVDNYLLLN